MIYRIFAGLWFLLASGVGTADEIQLNPDRPESYVVAKGDTLWDIAGRFLSKPWQWPEIWHDNPQVRDPHWIYPGDELRLTLVDGKPRLEISRPSELRLSPQIRVSPADRAIPTIPANIVRPFLTHPRVVGKGELEAAPYLVDFAEEHIVGGAGDRIYVRAIQQDDHAGYVLFRPGQAYKDADSGETLGYEALYVADARLEQAGDPATLQISQSQREAIIGDRLLPVEQDKVLMHFTPHAPTQFVRGHIIHVVDGVTQIGQYQVVIIDRGATDGLETGHVLDILQSGRTQRDIVSRRDGELVSLPEEKEGILMVFRTFDRLSFALIMKATRAIHINDAIQSP